MPLTSDQVRFFQHCGYLKLPERLSPDEVMGLREAILDGINHEMEPVVRDRTGRVVRISALWNRGDPFRAAMASTGLLNYLDPLLGPNIELILNRHNHATLRVAEEGSNYFHRDVIQWTRTILTVIFYLEETTVENGCTLIVPGTHFLPGMDVPDLGKDERIRRMGILEQSVPVPMPAGGMLAINSLLMHSAGENRTPGTRMSMTAGYHSVDELSRIPNPAHVLVRGERIYRGNDG
ncbi:MAG TPA: phytanoyl-CoA dioxygenase family protein [Armatimonadota bacterium]|nr:phytanoyl-CoA dioxygenase family protein [Armatimonadota bacterium]